MTVLEMLEHGIEAIDRRGEPIRYRLLAPSDDVEEITDLLHEAYAPLARAGMSFVASYQSSDVTRRRMDAGVTVVAVEGAPPAERVIGVVTERAPDTSGPSPHYERPDVAALSQLAVRPSHQRRRIGGRLIELVEKIAREQGAAELALDTPEDADHLVALYEARGYRFVAHAQFEAVPYRSVILSKQLEGSTSAGSVG